MPSIGDRIRDLRDDLPASVDLVAAAKTRSADEIRQALAAGIGVLGHNYVQEAKVMIETVGRDAAHWTLIGHLQRNKVKAAVQLFDSIQTLDSLRLAEAIERACEGANRIMSVLIEINAGRELQKSGVSPDGATALIRRIAPLPHLRIEGLMTMGPLSADPEDLRPLFRETRQLFMSIAEEGISNVSMKTLSMGMSTSYRVAIEEGATMIRLGTVLFGPRS